MADPKTMLTTQEFAKKAGVSAATVSKWLRSGKVEGIKEGRKWMISEDQLPGTAVVPKTTEKPKATSQDTPKASANKKSGNTSYSVEQFSAMTYLTPFGVHKYLKEGKLTGSKDASGNWEIDAANLEDKNLVHLLR